jgi:hypothetical protein
MQETANVAPDLEWTGSPNTKMPQTKLTRQMKLLPIPTPMARPADWTAYTVATPPGTQNSPDTIPHGVNANRDEEAPAVAPASNVAGTDPSSYHPTRRRMGKHVTRQVAVLYDWKTRGSIRTDRTARLLIGTPKVPNASAASAAEAHPHASQRDGDELLIPSIVATKPR